MTASSEREAPVGRPTVPSEAEVAEVRARIAALEREAKALEPDPRSARLYHELGLLWERPLGNLRAAAAAFQSAYRLAPPDDYQCVAILGIAQYRADQYPEALATLTRSGKLMASGKPAGHTVCNIFLTMTHHRLGQKDKALAELNGFRRYFSENDGSWSAKEKEEAQPFLREAEMLIEGSPGKSKE